MDRVANLLFAGMIVFALLLIGVNYLWPNDGQMFTTISNVLSGFTASFFTWISKKGEKGEKGDMGDGKTNQS